MSGEDADLVSMGSFRVITEDSTKLFEHSSLTIKPYSRSSPEVVHNDIAAFRLFAPAPAVFPDLAGEKSLKHLLVALSCFGALWLGVQADEVSSEKGTSIGVTAMGDCQISGQILDQQGNIVRSLGPVGPVKPGTHQLEWNGLDDQVPNARRGI